MTKKKDDDRCSEIINDYLDQKCDEDTGSQLMDTFAVWFVDKHDRERKDRIMESDEFEEKDVPELMSVEQRQELVVKLKKIRRPEQLPKKKSVRLWDRSLTRTLTRVAAVVIPLLVIGGVWMMNDNKSNSVVPGNSKIMAAQFTTPFGATGKELLTDSTQVTINAGSKLKITQNDTERIAELEGESYFNVTKDAQRPFKVKTQDLTVTVLGTEFNVEAYPDENRTVITLASGKIELINHAGKTWELTPGQQFVYTRTTGECVVEYTNIDDVKAWMSGEMVCSMKTLPEILRIVRRKFDIEIEMSDEVKNIDTKYSCSFRNTDSPESIIASLQVLTNDFGCKNENGRIYVTR